MSAGSEFVAAVANLAQVRDASGQTSRVARHPGWHRMVDAVAPGAVVVRLRPLRGGIATETTAVYLRGGPHEQLVVKRYRPNDPTAPLEWTTTASLEWERLKFVQRCSLPVPAPVACDLKGDWFGQPAVVMTGVPGRADVTPDRPDAWLSAIAHSLAALHATLVDGAEGALLRDTKVERWSPEGWAKPGALLDRVKAAVASRPLSLSPEAVLTHGDFHPGNLLWRGHRISGVVDWSATALDTRWLDLAQCRADVAIVLGPAAADQLRDAYEAATDRSSPDLALYDVMCAFEMANFYRVAIGAYREQGLAVTPRQAASRLRIYLQRALAAVE